FNGPEFFRLVFKRLGVEVPSTLETEQREMPKAALDIAPATSRPDPRLKALKNRCAHCHATGEGDFAFLRGLVDDILQTVRRTEIRERIEYRLTTETPDRMPPMTSRFEITPEERKQILDLLTRN